MRLPLDRGRMRERNLLDDIGEIELAAAQSPAERLAATLTLSDLALAFFRGNPDAPVLDRLEELEEQARLWAAPLKRSGGDGAVGAVAGAERPSRGTLLAMETRSARPAIFDLDIGNDPDDTVVALLIARAPERFRPRLLLTNDETPALGRARFLSQIVGSDGLHDMVAAGLPSPRRSTLSVVERAGLVAPGGASVNADGIGALVAAVDACDHVDYYSLGGLTNLAALLDRHPEFAERIHLIQMGPMLIESGLPRRAQYNVRLDPAAFFRAVPAVCSRTFLLSQISWARHEPGRRRSLGLYPDDPVAEALSRSPAAGHRLLDAQLGAWCQSGKPCSIQHDPLTTLSQHDARLVRYETLDLQFDASGLSDLSPSSRKRLLEIDEARSGPLSGSLTPSDPIHAALQVTARVSISADYTLARTALIAGLLGPDSAVRESDWSGFNRVHESA